MWNLKDAKTAHYYYVSYILPMKQLFTEAAISSNMKDTKDTVDKISPSSNMKGTKDTMDKASPCLYIPSS